MALVASNVVAAILAFLHPPVPVTLLFVYWAECVIIGVINVAKMYWIPAHMGPEADRHPAARLVLVGIGRTFTAAMFVLHYGFVAAIIGLGVIGLAGRDFDRSPSSVIARYFAAFAWPVAVLAVRHVYSFFANYLGKREYVGRKLEEQAFQPYRRILFMFPIVFAGIFIVIVTGSSAATALVIVPAKIIADLAAHFRDHRPAAAGRT